MSESEEEEVREENEVGNRIDEILGRIREIRDPLIRRRRKVVDRFFDAVSGRRSSRGRRASDLEEELLRENEELKAKLKKKAEEFRLKNDIAIEM